jgi:hypothetical protein
VRGRITPKQVLKWLALGVAIILAAILALGNNVGNGQTLPPGSQIGSRQTARCGAGLGRHVAVRSRPEESTKRRGEPCSTASDAGSLSHSRSPRHRRPRL